MSMFLNLSGSAAQTSSRNAWEFSAPSSLTPATLRVSPVISNFILLRTKPSPGTSHYIPNSDGDVKLHLTRGAIRPTTVIHSRGRIAEWRAAAGRASQRWPPQQSGALAKAGATALLATSSHRTPFVDRMPGKVPTPDGSHSFRDS